MIIIKSDKYKKDLQKKIIRKHKYDEKKTIDKIEALCIQSENLEKLILNPLSKVYSIAKKEGNLKEIYTANVNRKIRLYMKPKGEYPYKRIEITEIEFLEIDDKHYGEG